MPLFFSKSVKDVGRDNIQEQFQRNIGVEQLQKTKQALRKTLP